MNVHALANPGGDAIAAVAIDLGHDGDFVAIEDGQVRGHGGLGGQRVKERRGLLPQHDAVDGHARDAAQLEAGHVAAGVSSRCR